MNGRIRSRVVGLCLFLVAGLVLPAAAHTPLLYLEDNGDGTIYVEAGFSDGSSGAGMIVRLVDMAGQSLWEGMLDEFGAAESVAIPDVHPYYVVFEGGPGHEVRKEGIYAASTELVVPMANQQGVGDSTQDNASSISTGDPSEANEPAVCSTSDPAAPVSGTVSAWSPPSTLGAGWTVGESAATENAPYTTALWVIAGLLGVIALLLIFLVLGQAFAAGARFGIQHRNHT